MRNTGIGERLKQIRGAERQEDVAMGLGIAVSTWGRYEREERDPDMDFLLLLREKKGINSDWLISGQGFRYLGTAGTGADGVADESSAYGGFSLVPLYDVHAAAGTGAVVTSERIVDTLAFRPDFLRNELSAGPGDLYLIHVEGDSMEPTLRAGDVILVDHRRKVPDREGIYVIRRDDALLVKRLQLQPGGRILATSDNALYKPFDVDLKATETGLAIIGRVVWAGRRF